MPVSLIKRGICHVFGDHVPLDEGVMPFKFAIERVTDPKLLIPHLFKGTDPDFPSKVKPGDIVIAGEDFGCGKPHVQGFIAMGALGMSLVCGSMPYKSLRRAVSVGLPVLTGAGGAGAFASSGEEVEIDFETGEARNLSRGTQAKFPAMPPILRDIVANGGMNGALRSWLEAHPEQQAAPGQAAPASARGVPVQFVGAKAS